MRRHAQRRSLVPTTGGTYGRAELGPANLRLLDQAGLTRHFKAIQGVAKGALAGIVIGMAGARTQRDRNRILAAAAVVWPSTPCHATNDLETALMAAAPSTGSRGAPRVLILSGTGSCCFGRRGNGKTARVGGWGHVLGDKGSGYEIGLLALRAVVGELDRRGKWPALGARLLSALQWNEPDDLIDWVHHAEKTEVAALATTVFNAAARGNRMAREILDAAAAALAGDGVDCARRIAKAGGPVEFVFAGSVLLKHRGFARKVGARLRSLWPGARITRLPRESAWGAIELAKEHFGEGKRGGRHKRGIFEGMAVFADAVQRHSTLVSSPLPPTERRNPRSRNLDRLPTAKAVALMIREEGRVAAAVYKERRKIERAVVMIADSWGAEGGCFMWARERAEGWGSWTRGNARRRSARRRDGCRGSWRAGERAMEVRGGRGG